MKKLGVLFTITLAVMAVTVIILGSIGMTTNATDLAWTAQISYPTSHACQTTVPERTERDVGALMTAGTQTEKTNYCFEQDAQDRYGPAQPVREAMVHDQLYLTTEYKALSLARDWPMMTATTNSYNTAIEKSNGDRFAVACIERRCDSSSFM